MKPAEIGGVFVAAIAPRRASGHEIDVGQALEVVDFLCKSGVAGIALLGSTGEFIHFDIGDRQRLVSLAVKRSRVPVLANVAHSTLDGAVKLAQDAADSGAAGVLLMPPYYFHYGQEMLREFYLQFARELNGRVPVFLYNIPFFTDEIACETACELLATGQFAGIKDSSGRGEYLRGLLAQRAKTPFTLMIGNDVIFTEGRSSGADGVVSGVACALPELMLGLDRAIANGDAGKRDCLQSRLSEFIGWLDRMPTPVGVREAAGLRGLKIGPGAVPAGEAGRRAVEEFHTWFKEWLPQVLREAA